MPEKKHLIMSNKLSLSCDFFKVMLCYPKIHRPGKSYLNMSTKHRCGKTKCRPQTASKLTYLFVGRFNLSATTPYNWSARTSILDSTVSNRPPFFVAGIRTFIVATPNFAKHINISDALKYYV